MTIDEYLLAVKARADAVIRDDELSPGRGSDEMVPVAKDAQKLLRIIQCWKDWFGPAPPPPMQTELDAIASEP